VNHKHVYRLYRENGLNLRLRRPRRNVSAANRECQPAASAPNEMTRISAIRDTPRTIRVDNGPEFISKALDR